MTVIGNTGLAAAAPSRTYDPTSIPTCESCGAKRVFECQLMPNLINVTAASTKSAKPLTDEQRRADVQASLQKHGSRRGMEWGTCMVFSCSEDCGKGSAWVEETVLVQWED
jgi:pre-rRNA-processing protein TSR4